MKFFDFDILEESNRSDLNDIKVPFLAVVCDALRLVKGITANQS